jgi:hypothetical protein
MRSELQAWRRAVVIVLRVVCIGMIGVRPGAAITLERILAVVDGRPVMLSEVQLLQRVRALDQAAALQALIDERLMLREAARLPQAAVAVQEEDQAYASLIALHRREVMGIAEADLRRLARRQTAILKYVEFRFRSQVRVPDDDLRKAYREQYQDREGAPPFENVAEGIRSRLAARMLDERIEAWIRELRAASEIRLVPLEEGSAPAVSAGSRSAGR